MLHPLDCRECMRLHRMTVARVRLTHSKTPVLSWCRICGMPVLLEVVNDYEYAKNELYILDDMPMQHKGIHAEQSNWGAHWRFDEVLRAVFGERHEDDCWPPAPWYEQEHCQGMDLPVAALSPQELRAYSREHVDVERRMLSEWLNKKPPRTPEQIKEAVRTDWVWDHDEVRDAFEILMFKAPYAIAIHKETGQRGTLLFQDTPRYYFAFDPDRLV